MINPPTRPYSQEELRAVLKRLCTSEPKTSRLPQPSVTPLTLQLKTPILVETLPPVIFRNSGSPTEHGLLKNGIHCKVEPTIDLEGRDLKITQKKSTINFTPWIFVGGIAIAAAAVYYFHQKEKKKQNSSK